MKQGPPIRYPDLDAQLKCADAYLRLAEPARIRTKDLEESKEPGSLSPAQADSVASATNLAFAIELYIKAILFVSKIDGHGHNLGKLYAKMPPHIRVEIESVYEKMRKKDWNSRYGSITLSFGQVPAGTLKWDGNRNNSFDLEGLLNRSSDMFTTWRYIFEFKKPDEGGWQSTVWSIASCSLAAGQCETPSLRVVESPDFPLWHKVVCDFG